MRKLNLLLIIALATMLAGLTFGQVSIAAAQEVPLVGVVVDYIPGQSITIVDQSGTQHQYTISSTLKILPAGRANSLAVGSFVTIIAPASLSQGKQAAVGIVIHPHIPNGWNVPSLSATPTVTSTAVETFTAPATETLTVTVTGTPLPPDTATATATGTQLATETATPTPPGTIMDTSTPTPIGGGTTATTNTLMEWLRSLFQQILSSR